ncbi:MAG: ABC transporter substrate-binding protein [Sulfurospirillaceae bacterium]|nr:ABC transporter substrate-binding protein [Sulfurospirillaceae bacterium]
MKRNIVVLLLFVLNLYSNDHLIKLSVQLDWKYQFQHAGLIMAKEKGYYKDVGLDVDLREYKKGIDIAQDVLSGKADFGLSNTSLIYGNDGKLQPTVLLATYLQKSPLVFVTQPNITNPSMLNGKKIMITNYEARNSSLSLLLDYFSVDYTFVPHSYTISAFKNKKVDALSAFTSNELYELNKEKIPYNIIDPADYGFVTNAMNLFSSYKFAKENPNTIKKFLSATKKGWEYSLEHMNKTVEIIHRKYRPDSDVQKLLYEAKVIKKLMLLDFFNLGETNKDLMYRVYKQLVKSGKLRSGQSSHILTFTDILNEIKNQPISFNKKEKAFLTKKGKIKVCGNPDMMPFEGIINGKHVGIIGDIVKLIKQKTNLNIILYPTKSWGECIKAIKDKKCDFAASITKTPKRSKYINFTEDYLHFPIVIATKNDKPFVDDISKIRDKKLGVNKNFAIIEILKLKNNNNINLVEVNSTMAGLKKVENGELYGYINDLTTVAPLIQKHFSGTLKISGRLQENDDISIGVRNDEPILRDIFQKIIMHITPAEKQEIFNKWISVKQVVGIDYKFIWEIVGLFIFIFAILLAYLLQLRKYNKNLKNLSRIDALTQIANRLKIDEILREQQQLVDRYDLECSLAIFDIDDFKMINDTYGHLAGDQILKEISNLIGSSIRKTDLLGRWGGEEFMLICPNTNLENLEVLVHKIKENINKTIFFQDSSITVSIGIGYLAKNKSIDYSLNLTDNALYKAKNNGKNRVEHIDVNKK